MKKIVLLSLFTAFTSHAFGTTVSIGNIDGWLFQEVQENTILSYFTGGAEGVLTTKTANGNDVAVMLRRVGPAPMKNLNSTRIWRNAAFGPLSKKVAFIHERLLNHQGQLRYFAEFQSDVGTETMLNATVLAVAVEGYLYLLTYEQHAKSYKIDVPNVHEMLKKVAVKSTLPARGSAR